MKLGVTGTRDGLSGPQALWLKRAIQKGVTSVTEFHSGDCTGVDDLVLWALIYRGGYSGEIYLYPALVSEVWRARALDTLREIEYPGQITQYEPLPPLVRNGHIALACDELWAFPGSGGGTWDCIRKARVLDRVGWIIYQDGKLEAL